MAKSSIEMLSNTVERAEKRKRLDETFAELTRLSDLIESVSCSVSTGLIELKSAMEEDLNDSDRETFLCSEEVFWKNHSVKKKCRKIQDCAHDLIKILKEI